MADALADLRPGLRTNQSLVQQMLGGIPPCRCARTTTWWGRRRPVEHTEECRAREAYQVEVELALVMLSDALASDDLAVVDASTDQVHEATTAGYRWLAAGRT